MRIPALVRLFYMLYNEKNDPNECWEWNGCRITGGYGQLRYKGKRHVAHKVAYLEMIGHIPKDMVVMHKCDNPPCINPNHLKLGTFSDNTQDAINKGRFRKPNIIHKPRKKARCFSNWDE